MPGARDCRWARAAPPRRAFHHVALSNGSLSILTDLFAAAGLTWHCVLSGEMVRANKPDPAVYWLALDRLALDPRRTLMVAANPWDLRRRRLGAVYRLYNAPAKLLQHRRTRSTSPSRTWLPSPRGCSPRLDDVERHCCDVTPPASTVTAKPTHRNPVRSTPVTTSPTPAPH